MSIWDWVRDSIRRAHAAGNPNPLRLYEMYQEAMSYHSKDPAQTTARLIQARDLAIELQEPWWAQFCEHWRLQTLLCDQRDYGQALDGAVHAAIETRKPPYAQFPQRICIQEDMIMAYMGIDPEGYGDHAEQALNYMQAEVSQEAECNQCINELRTEIAIRLNRLDVAEASALAALQQAKAKGDRMHSAIAFRHLCIVAFRRGDYGVIAGYAQEAVTDAYASSHNASILGGLMWQALAARKAGDERTASRTFRTAVARLKQTDALPGEDFYEALTALHEAVGAYDQALQTRQHELAKIEGKGQIAHECLCRLEICRLRRLLGQTADIEAELQTIEAVAALLKKPASVLAKVQQLRENATRWGVS